MEFNGDLLKGHISTVILKSLLDGDKYGYEIAKIIESNSQGKFVIKQPTLYSTLKRLQSQGLISSYWLDSEIGGRRHYYKLTEQGSKQIESSKDEWNASRLVIDSMVTDTPLSNLEGINEIAEELPIQKPIVNANQPKNEVNEAKEIKTDNEISTTPPSSLFEFAEIIKAEQDSKEILEGKQKLKAGKEWTTVIEENTANLKEIELRKSTQIHYTEPDIKKPTSTANNKSYFEKQHSISSGDFKFNISSPVQSEEFVGDFTFDDKVISENSSKEENIIKEDLNFEEFKDVLKQENTIFQPINEMAENNKLAPNSTPTKFENTPNNSFANINVKQETLIPKSYYPIKSFNYPDDYGKAKNIKAQVNNETIKDNLIKKDEDLPETVNEIDYKGILGDLYAPIDFKLSDKVLVKSNVKEQYEENKSSEDVNLQEDRQDSKIEELAKPKPKPMFDATIKEYFSTSKKQSAQTDENAEKADKITKKSNIKFNSYNKKTDSEFSYNYVLQNKLKFVQSIIMFVIMMLTIAGSYILLDYYDMLAQNSNTLFILAVLFVCFLPFLSLIAYLANPDKKTSTNFNLSLNLFVKIIATLATLVFIYAFNLFLGMTDLNQVEFYANWLVPSLLSSSYIISTFVYALLVKSKKYSL
ncbi:MAG: helix-turn-helix transcriptional regulator [Clostridia bacterium]|jgi:PadR family transcriptional regulator PadR|nr:helix-turn-helix transcriptional regulator [Clostridia bacterium]